MSRVFVYCVCVCVSYLCCRHAYWLVWTGPLTSTYTTGLKNSFDNIGTGDICFSILIQFRLHTPPALGRVSICSAPKLTPFSGKVQLRAHSLGFPGFLCADVKTIMLNMDMRTPPTPSLLNNNISVFPSSLWWREYISCFSCVSTLWEFWFRRGGGRKIEERMVWQSWSLEGEEEVYRSR